MADKERRTSCCLSLHSSQVYQDGTERDGSGFSSVATNVDTDYLAVAIINRTCLASSIYLICWEKGIGNGVFVQGTFSSHRPLPSAFLPSFLHSFPSCFLSVCQSGLVWSGFI